jgi:uncharacterized protein YqjF (DUF2071 family)
MEKVKPKGLPAFPPISNFDEVNVRTYVIYKGKPLVYFLSLEAGKRISNFLCKTMSGLPYRYSRTKLRGNSYKCESKEGNKLHLEYELGEKRENKTALELWLTERYGLAHEYYGQQFEHNIHHIEWPFQEIKITKLDYDYPQFSTLLIGEPDLVAYSPGVQVVAWT